MIQRQRVLDAYAYNNPDRVPVRFGLMDAGLHVHGQKMLDLLHAHAPDSPNLPQALPVCPASDINQKGEYKSYRLDEWGTNWEYNIFGVAGHPAQYPISDMWENAADYQFPPLPDAQQQAQACVEVDEQKKDFFVHQGWLSIFEKMHALYPMTELLPDLAEEDEDCLAFLDRLVDYQEKVIDSHLDAGADEIVFGDDWGTQGAAMMSLPMFKNLFGHHYRRLFTRIHDRGAKIFLHSCGCLSNLLDEFMELGVDAIWPQIYSYDEDELFKKCQDNGVCLYVHPDRQYLVPRGTPVEIDEAIKRYCGRFHAAKGGGSFNIEIENDAPWENVVALFEALEKYR